MILRIENYTYEQATDLLRFVPKISDTVVDLGAGKRDSPISSQVKRIVCNRLISVEAFEPYLHILLSEPIAANEHDVVKAHITNSHYKIPKCDVVLMIDVIEHLEKGEALTLLEELKVKADKIIIFTPEGDTIGYSNNDMGNELQQHKSYWTAEEFDKLGFSFISVFEGFHTHIKNEPVGAIWAIWER